MVTHDPRAAVIADRIFFLADGKIAGDLSDASVEKVLEVMSTLQ
jgi:putative ABC transport system ATP-binding protein